MPYITVRSTIDEPISRTGISGNDTSYKSTNISSAMASLSATQVDNTNSPFCSYNTSVPPDLVLDTLERQVGYVVAADSVVEIRSENHRAYWQIWTLQA